MKKHSLATKGLSLSQAQSISNLCNQASRDIDAQLKNINNVSKTLKIDNVEYIETQGNPMPSDIVQLLNTKSKLHATQAFLMENIKAKDTLLSYLKSKKFVYDAKCPEYPELEEAIYQDTVTEEWGWEQLSAEEVAEYLEAESYASHIGQFIHKGGKLDLLRKELPTIKTLEWIDVEAGKRTPLMVTIHHTLSQLTETHENLAALHRAYEQRVNYFKAKVKNLVTLENARIEKENAELTAVISERNDKLREEYQVKRGKYMADKTKAMQEFESARQQEISNVAALRIQVDPRFKHVIDRYLKQIEE